MVIGDEGPSLRTSWTIVYCVGSGLLAIVCQKPGTIVVLYRRALSVAFGAGPAGTSGMVSEKTVIPQDMTVKVDFADMGESARNVTVGSMLRRGRGCGETRTTSSYTGDGQFSKTGEGWGSTDEESR